MRRVKETVPLRECRRRALGHLVEFGPGLCAPSSVARSIWPDAKFIRAQGAGAAASRVLKTLIKDGLAVWKSLGPTGSQVWGYQITPLGRTAWRAATKEQA